MRWMIDPALPTAIFEQLAQRVRSEIAEGGLSAGDRLPAAREVAESLDINVHTVLHAYQVLRDDRVIELRRGRGAVVLQPPSDHSAEHFADALAAEAKRRGLALADLTELLKGRLA